jgi:hypothetical protein
LKSSNCCQGFIFDLFWRASGSFAGKAKSLGIVNVAQHSSKRAPMPDEPTLRVR